MDVSAPRPLQSATTPLNAVDPIAVRPAPRTMELPKSAPVASAKPQQNHPQEQPAATTHPQSGAPVGVITVAVLVMMLLSAAAVIVYATSQTA